MPKDSERRNDAMLMKKTTKMLAGLLAALLLATALPGEALAATYVYVTASSTYIYKTANTGSVRLKSVAQGESVLCGATSGKWAYIKYNGTTGYVLKDDLSKNAPAQNPTEGNLGETTSSAGGSQTDPVPSGSQSASGISAYTTKTAKLYRSASTSSACYGTIPKGKALTCYKTSGVWAYVKVGKYTGYMLKNTLAASKTQTGSTSSPSTSAPVSNSGVVCYVKNATKLLSCASLAATGLADLQVGDKILVTHSKQNWCRVITTDGKIGYMPYACVSKTKVYASGTVVLKDWFTSDIQDLFPVGTKVVVTDVETRKCFTVYRKGGTNHADCEPLTTADTATMLAVYGGAWSWERRPIWVTINGVTYAASMNGMNHGEGEIYGNDFEGHFCMHFVNSRTHGSNKVDADHQAAILAAAKTKP